MRKGCGPKARTLRYARRMRPLETIRILDMSRLLPGPFATMVLADLGATVDRLEAPDGDTAFPLLNRGKRTIKMDLKANGAAAAFIRLAGAYDVVFETFRPGVMDRLGIGHRTLGQAHPRLIICALTGYGQNSQRAARAGHDLNYVARAGLLGVNGPEGQPPQVPGVQIADIGGGLFAVIAILAALRERDRTGKGTVLDLALCEAAIPFATAALSGVMAGEREARGAGVLTGGIAPYNTYATSDGGFVALAALEPRFLRWFCEGAGIAFDEMALVPGPHQEALKRTYRALFATKTRDEWSRFAAEHDCCLELVLEPREIVDDADLRARGVWVDAAGERRLFRTPVTPRDEEPAAHRSGEHAHAILGDAGFLAHDIERLREGGIVQ